MGVVSRRQNTGTHSIAIDEMANELQIAYELHYHSAEYECSSMQLFPQRVTLVIIITLKWQP